MIEQEFDSSKIRAIELGVSLFDGNRYMVPVDGSVDKAFKEMLAKTTGSINIRTEDWSEYSVSQDYGRVERVYTPRSDPLFSELNHVYEADGLRDMANLPENAKHVDFYFVVYHDEDGRKAVGVRRAQTLKATLAARNRLVQFVNDTLILVDHPVFRLDVDFDGLIFNDNIYFSNFQAMEAIAKITNKVAAAAAQKISIIESQVSFIDFSGYVDKIKDHPRTARLLIAISKRANIGKYDKAEVLAQATAQGVKFINEGEAKLRCRVADRHKLLEVLDDRRWISRNATDGPIAYRAPSRQRTRD